MSELTVPVQPPVAPTDQGPSPPAIRMLPTPKRMRLLLLRYGAALVIAALAVFLREILTPLWGYQLPYLTLFPAAMLSAWYGGLGPGIMTAVLCATAAAYLWLTPFHVLAIDTLAGQVGLVIAVLEMLLIAWFTAALRQARETLEQRVQERTAELARANVALQEEVTAHTQAEERLHTFNTELEQRVEAQTAALRESEERFRILADSAPVLIWVNGLEGCELVNQEYLRFLNVRDADVRGLGWVSFVHPGDLDSYVASYRAAMIQKGLFEAQFRFRRHDGVYRWMKSAGVPRFGGNGKFLGYAGSTVDITDMKLAQEALTQHARDLARANADLRQISYIAAHELQEPVRQVSIYTQKIARRYGESLDGPTSEAVRFILEGGQRMVAQLNDLLHYLDVDETIERRVMVDCEVVLQRALAQLREPITASGATITHDPLPVVSAHPTQLQLVFQELLDNAVKFRTTVPPQVHIEAEREAQGWRFTVRDNGIGIDPQYVDKLFGFFKRLDRNSYPGTGMGLAICKKIVERHGGSIRIEPTPGGGTTMIFTIGDVKDE